jgi:tyrosyl-tRNA synthetase
VLQALRGHALLERLPELKEGLAIFALVAKVGLAESNSEARKLVRGKGVRLDDAVVEDEKHVVKLEAGQQLKLSVGKKRHVLVRAA